MRKLTDEQVVAIKADKRVHRLVALDYNVDPSVVTRVKNETRHNPKPRIRVEDCKFCGAERWVLKGGLSAKSRTCRSCGSRERWRNRLAPKTLARSLKKSREYNEQNKIKLTMHYMRQREALRAEMVFAYGGKCLRCSEADPAVLVLDHIHDDGADERRRGFWGDPFFKQLKRQGFPRERLQLLCYNCNARKEMKRRRVELLRKLLVAGGRHT